MLKPTPKPNNAGTTTMKAMHMVGILLIMPTIRLVSIMCIIEVPPHVEHEPVVVSVFP